jgi:hypothetical protein
MVGAGCGAAMKFLEKRVALSVREILYSEITKQYFSQREIPYYRVGTSDPPARLTADLDTYSKEVWRQDHAHHHASPATLSSHFHHSHSRSKCINGGVCVLDTGYICRCFNGS